MIFHFYFDLYFGLIVVKICFKAKFSFIRNLSKEQKVFQNELLFLSSNNALIVFTKVYISYQIIKTQTN
jgi:hypothetical protein